MKHDPMTPHATKTVREAVVPAAGLGTRFLVRSARQGDPRGLGHAVLCAPGTAEA